MILKSKRRVNATEPESLAFYDTLNCQGCKGPIWAASPFARGWSWSEIDRAYHRHAKNCFALKRLLIHERKNT